MFACQHVFCLHFTDYRSSQSACMITGNLGNQLNNVYNALPLKTILEFTYIVIDTRCICGELWPK